MQITNLVTALWALSDVHTNSLFTYANASRQKWLKNSLSPNVLETCADKSMQILLITLQLIGTQAASA